jgi:plasmid segregation protein ParM
VPQAVIDVGGRTTDLFWARGMQPDVGRCAGLAVGVEQAGDVLGEQFLSTYARELRPHELRTMLRAYASGSEPPPLYADGARVHLNGEVGVAVDGVGEAIGSFVARMWRSSERGKVAGEAARVLLIGGGAYYVAPHLKRLIPHLEVPRSPELANASGYLAVGQHVPDAAWARLRGA